MSGVDDHGAGNSTYVSTSSSIISSFNSRRRRSRIVSLPDTTSVLGENILVELDEMSLGEENRFKVPRKSSFSTPTTVGGISLEAIADTERKNIFKEIRRKIGHHSPDIKINKLKNEDMHEIDSKSQDSREIHPYGEGILRKYFYLYTHHLHLAFAAPSLIRIPHLAYKYASKSGSAFVLAYFLALILVVIPISVLETIMAQYSSLGPINIFDCCLPLLKGVGYGMVLTCGLLMLVSSTLLTWSSFYFFQSLRSELLWVSCPNNSTNVCKMPNMLIDSLESSFNDSPLIPSDYYFQGYSVTLPKFDHYDVDAEVLTLQVQNHLISSKARQRVLSCEVRPGVSYASINHKPSKHSGAATIASSALSTSSSTRMNITKSLEVTDGSPLQLNFPLVAASLILWSILLFFVSRREIWRVKLIACCFALLTLFTVLSMMIIGLNLENSGRGLTAAFQINFTSIHYELAEPTLWLDSLGQGFWSMGPTIGLLINRASYNNFHKKIVSEVYTAAFFNVIVQTLIMIMVFSFAGHIYTSDSRDVPRISLPDTTSVLGENILVELDEMSLGEENRFKVPRKSSFSTPTTVGGISLEAIADTERKNIFKEIRRKIGHHSPDIKINKLKNEDMHEIDSKSQDSREIHPYGEGILRKYFYLYTHHLHLAFAAPSLIRIPHLAYKYASKSGSAFVLAYFLALILVVIPISVLETIMAQYSSLGPINIFDCCLPLLKGVGYGMVLTCGLLMLVSSTLLTWSSFYFFQSLRSELLWVSCPNNATNVCKMPDVLIDNNLESSFNDSPLIPSDYYFQEYSVTLRKCDHYDVDAEVLTLQVQNHLISSEARQRVLSCEVRPGVSYASIHHKPSKHRGAAAIASSALSTSNSTRMNITKSLEVTDGSPLQLNFPLVAASLILWSILLFFVSRREIWRVKLIACCFALLTLFTVLSMMIIGLNLENSGRGLTAAFQINFTSIHYELAEPTLWLDSLGQGFWSMGPTIGLLINRASYNNFHKKIVSEVYTAAFFNVIVQTLIMIMVFSFAGHIYTSDSREVPRNIGYFFVMSSYAVTEAPLPHVAAFFLFFCVSKNLFTHTIMLAETVATSLSDALPPPWRSGTKRLCIDFIVCAFGFLLSLIFLTKEGIYYLTNTDAMLPWIAGITLGLLEVAALTWIYRTARISDHFMKMLRSRTISVAICKYFVIPVLLVFLLWVAIMGIRNPVSWEHLATPRENSYFSLGLGFALLPVALAIFVLFLQMCRNFKDPGKLLIPSADWGSALSRHQELLMKKAPERRDRSKPWLAIKVDYAKIPENLSSWIPYGYSWVPDGPASKLIKEGHSDINPLMREALAKLLLKRLGKNKEKNSCEENRQNTESQRIFVLEEGTNLRERRGLQFSGTARDCAHGWTMSNAVEGPEGRESEDEERI